MLPLAVSGPSPGVLGTALSLEQDSDLQGPFLQKHSYQGTEVPHLQKEKKQPHTNPPLKLKIPRELETNDSPADWAAQEISALQSCGILVLAILPGSLIACPNTAGSPVMDML